MAALKLSLSLHRSHLTALRRLFTINMMFLLFVNNRLAASFSTELEIRDKMKSKRYRLWFTDCFHLKNPLLCPHFTAFLMAVNQAPGSNFDWNIIYAQMGLVRNRKQAEQAEMNVPHQRVHFLLIHHCG